MVLGDNDYYPFGMGMPGRKYYQEGGYRYGFNGKENDNDISDDDYNFGARIYDGRIAKWLSIDPIQGKYPDLSPYNFVANTPLNATDPDGKLIIFVNGFRSGAYQEYLMKTLYPTLATFNHRELPPWETRGGAYSKTDRYGGNDGNYWGDIDNMFMDKIGDHNAVYTDGGYRPHSSARDRYSRGFSDGLAILLAIKNGDIEVQRDENGNVTETIKIVGHSHGGWHSAGMADALALTELAGLGKVKVEVLYMINPHQPNGDAEILGDYRSVQYSRPSDLLSSGEVNTGSGFKSRIKRRILRWILKDFGNSKMARMKGVSEKADLKNLSNIETMDGHFVDDAQEIGQIPSGRTGAIEKRKDKR